MLMDLNGNISMCQDDDVDAAGVAERFQLGFELFLIFDENFHNPVAHDL